MMITTANYEAFYLDYLEGTLTAAEATAFEEFIAVHPELEIALEDIDSVALDPLNTPKLSEFNKCLLKSECSIAELSATNVDYFLIADQEGLLTSTETLQLKNWLEKHPTFLTDHNNIHRTKLQPVESDKYTHRSALYKKPGLIIPLWWGTVAAAASIALYFSLGIQQPISHSALPHLARQTVRKPVIKPKVPTALIKEKSNKTNKSFQQGTKTTLPAIVPEVHENTLRLPEENQQQPIAQLPVLPITVASTVTPSEYKTISNSDLAYVSFSDMKNPMAPITVKLTEKLGTPIDFRSAKSTTNQKGGFYLKIGKFELSHRGNLR